MPTLKKGVLYGILFFVVVWMFVLGIFVGRGSAPVKFDTRGFQKKLAHIAGEYEAENKNAEETDIQFYEDLKTPMSGAETIPENASSVTKKIENDTQMQDIESPALENRKVISLKTSMKSRTKKEYAAKVQKASTFSEKAAAAPQKKTVKPAPSKDTEYKYTIQIAAFKDMKSAFDKISSLKAKGHAAYRTIGKVQDVTWYRVRVGRFTDTEVARQYLRKLKKDNINGIIIKQDS